MDARFAETVEFLRARIPVPPVVGVILGSGLGDFAAAVEDRLEIPYAQIPGFPSSAVVGHAGTLVAGTLAGVPIVVLSGRIHFYEGHPMSSVVTPARVLGLLGCRDVVVTNAAGGIDTSFSAGDLMLISDHINLFGTNPLIGPNDETFGARFPDMSDAYRSDLRTLAKAVARRVKVPLKEGVYVGVTGPSYETPAEIRAFRALGAHAVGMSTVPEVIALGHMGVGVVGVSCITNMAAGVLKQPLHHDEVLETTRRVRDRFVRLLTALVAAMGEGRSPDRLVVVPSRKTPAGADRAKAGARPKPGSKAKVRTKAAARRPAPAKASPRRKR
jgi:purine-nucleoside phosphorylase